MLAAKTEKLIERLAPFTAIGILLNAAASIAVIANCIHHW